MDFQTMVGIANIISAIAGIIAIYLGIKAVNKVYNFENNIGEINQEHSGKGDNVGRNKNVK